MESVKLPVKNQSGYYEIRLESIGGLGANLCGKMLGELGLQYLGLNSTSFSSYGSEKTGTPVKAYIRYGAMEEEIRVHSPVTHPHLLGIFHEALLTDRSILEGCRDNTQIVLNTEHAPWEAAKLYRQITSIRQGGSEGMDMPKGEGKSGRQVRSEGGTYEADCGEQSEITARLCCVPAQRIAMETHSRINVVMLGAMARVMGFVPFDALCDICEKTLGKKYPEALAANLQGIKKGYEDVIVEPMKVTGSMISVGQSKDIMGQEAEGNQKCNKPNAPEWGYATAPVGGINPRYGNSVISDLSPSRQGYIPLFIQERCINCGLCDSTCPDMVFQFQKGEYKGKEMMINKGLDYYHCKGCLRCVSVCPVQALVAGLEADHPQKEWFISNQELLRTPDYYEKTGPDGYITSESYLTEKRMGGGEV